MAHFRLASSMALAGLVSLMSSVSAYAQDSITIVTPVPEPKESQTAPEGYTSCFNVTAGWYKGVWYPERRVCQYDPDRAHGAQGDAYVEGHWACTKYLTEEQLNGQCTNWDWKPAHWIKNLPVY